MRYVLAVLLLLAGCTYDHRLAVVYESGDAAVSSSSSVLIESKEKSDD